MQLKVTFKNTDVKDDVRQHAEEKLEKITKFMQSPVQVNFIFHKDKLEHTAELTVSGDGAHLTAYVSAGDFFSAIDDSIDKMVTQLKKHKEKMKDRKGSKKPELL